MAEQRQDRRVRRSKAQLRQALIQLLQEKPVEEITVRELTERADVNRGTFYSHYQNIYHMLEQVENELFDELGRVAVETVYKPSDAELWYDTIVAFGELVSTTII